MVKLINVVEEYILPSCVTTETTTENTRKDHLAVETKQEIKNEKLLIF